MQKAKIDKDDELNLLKRKREILDETKKIRGPEKALAHWESTTPVRL